MLTNPFDVSVTIISGFTEHNSVFYTWLNLILTDSDIILYEYHTSIMKPLWKSNFTSTAIERNREDSQYQADGFIVTSFEEILASLPSN